MARKADFRTPLNRVRFLGSAKDGTDHFWRQRVTALANLPLVLFLVILTVSLVGAPHGDVTARLGAPLIAIPLLLAILSITWHMRLGMQVIVEDYVHGELLKITLLILNIFFAAAVALTAAFAILKLGFGG